MNDPDNQAKIDMLLEERDRLHKMLLYAEGAEGPVELVAGRDQFGELACYEIRTSTAMIILLSELRGVEAHLRALGFAGKSTLS